MKVFNGRLPQYIQKCEMRRNYAMPIKQIDMLQTLMSENSAYRYCMKYIVPLINGNLKTRVFSCFRNF